METILASMTYGPSRQVSSPTICWEWSIRPLVKSGSAFSVWSTPADISNSIYSYCAFTESSVCCSTQSARLTFYFFCTVGKTSFERVRGVELRVNNNRYMECHHHRFHEITPSIRLEFMWLLVTVIRTRWIHLMEIFQRSTFVFTDANHVRLYAEYLSWV